MDWWQILLIILISVVVGLLVGGLLGYLILRLQKKPFPLFVKRGTLAAVDEQSELATPDLLAKVEEKHIVQPQKKPLFEKHEKAAVVKEQLKPTAPTLLSEVRDNRRIASEPWGDRLLPFQTQAWETNREVHKLPTDLREALAQVYVDMSLANSIAWLSTDLGRRSQNLDEHYKKLCTNIAAKLDKIIPLLEQSGD